MPTSKIIRNVIMLIMLVIIIASLILIAFFAYYYLFNNLKEGLTSGTSIKPYNIATATLLASNAIASANAEYPNACNGPITNKNVQSGLRALDATGITNPVLAIFNARCNWIWSDAVANTGTVTTETIQTRRIKARQLAIEGVNNIIVPAACSSATNRTIQGALGALNINTCDPTSVIYNNTCTWNWACDTDDPYYQYNAAATLLATNTPAVNTTAANTTAANTPAVNTTSANQIALLQNNVKIAQDKLEKFIGYTNEYTNELETVDNKLDTAQYEKKQAQDAIDRAAASIPSAKTLQDTITAQTDKILADSKILTGKEEQAKLKVKMVTTQAVVATARAELQDAKSKLIAAQGNASASINANPPSVIATTAGTPSGYQNTSQFDSVPGLTTGDNNARAITQYFGNLLQNLLTIVKHDQTHNAIANAHNILTNSGNRAYSTNLVSSQSALNPQAGYPTMNYPSSSTTDLADYSSVNASNVNANTRNSQSCSGSYPLAYNCVSTSIDF